MKIRYLLRYFAFVCLSLVATTHALAADAEPNDQPDQAVGLNPGTPVEGVWHLGDGSDHYRLKLPASGIVTVKLDGYPDDCGFQVVVLGFQEYTTSTAGFVDGKPGKPLTFRFAARGGFDGYLAVRLNNVVSSVTGSGWGAVRCQAGGPWYLTPRAAGGDTPPDSHDGAPLQPPIRYRLTVSHQPLPDAYEHQDLVGVRYPELLQQGRIKTIPIGREIEAFLFNDYPRLIRDAEQGIDQPGGEDDLDVYHVSLPQADTVRVSLSAMPAQANVKIFVYYPGGWKDAETGATQLECEVPRAGDLFVEIKRGDRPEPLVFAEQPYRLAVTTASTKHVIQSGDPGATGTNGPPTPPKIDLGQPVAVGGEEVGPGGGAVVINKPGDLLDGLKIEVPGGAYPGATKFTVSHQPINGHQLGPLFRPITPLIRVENGGGYAGQPMKLTIPIQLPPAHFAMPFYYDPATGDVDGMPVIALDEKSVTALTRHFSWFTVSAIPITELEKLDVDTGFTPGVDDWQCPNIGTHASPGGRCAGMCLTAMWHYERVSRQDRAGKLWGAFDNDNIDQATPTFWEDDQLAHRLTSTVQEDLQFNSQLANAWVHFSEAKPEYAWRTLRYALAIEKLPQLIGVHRRQSPGGHAVVAYRVAGDTLYVADPNFPGDTSTMRQIRFAGGAFTPYKSAANAEEAKDPNVQPYDCIGYYGRGVFVPVETIQRRWAEMKQDAAGGTYTIGKHLFAEVDVYVKGRNGQPRQLLKSGHFCDEPMLELEIVQRQAGTFLPKFGIYRWHQNAWVKGENPAQIPLQPGINRIGVLSFCWHTKQVNGKMKTKLRWNGFQWFDVYHFTLKIEPPVQQVAVGQPARFRAVPQDAGDMEFRRFEWYFEDASPWHKSQDPTATHVYDQPGEYEVIGRLVEDVTGKLLADGRAKVIVKGLAISNLAVRIEHNAGGRLQNGAILPRGQVSPTGPRTLLGDLSGGKPGVPYDFRAVVTGLPVNAAVQYEWSFADVGGPVVTQTNATQHAFSRGGNHTVIVRVLDKSKGQELGRGQTTVSISG